jgi:acid phosphatase (class A)
MLRKFLFVAVALTLAACDGGSKYPYPSTFVAPAEVNPRSIPIPYAQGSKQWNDEMEFIIAEQQKLTPADIRAIRDESSVVLDMITTPILGDSLNKQSHPATIDLLAKSGSDSWRISDITKDYWGTTRPWLVDNRVRIFAEPIYSPAYPSGHTVTNFVWVEVLGELFPHLKERFYARASEIANHRIQGGVHSPNDVAGGKILAKEISYRLLADSDFQKALAAAKAELRAHPVKVTSKSCCKKGHCPKKR